ncbi:hypothetical protein [Clostridium coskatii]|uniref:Uncharacterized protein n=1 Tax=Clostridium coskatii TaxID=1705578 RepID=A0A168NFH9_9CLOT|nr:hypothetical protein [Clostridium coskatii]OAA86346.1 hypothetical protein WX73_02840 [Clostridium coskatii]OAA86364.1 hypothetical protein WX73_02858 [Clostridium coskatii]OBR95069.1 hypothetical protein CLCOS_17740 [Clostridium coskatii]
MSLFDFVDEICDISFGIGEACFDLVTGLGEIAVDSTLEFGELMTDGVKEIVIKDNDNYKTSFEKTDDANDIISMAKSKFNSASQEAIDYYEETKKIVEEHFQYKNKLITTILPQQEEIIRNFTEFNYTNLANSIDTLKLDNKPILFSTTLVFLSKLNPITLGIEIGSFMISQRTRVEAANEYLSNAECYKSEVDLKIAELKTIKSRLTLIRNKVIEERKILNNLVSKLDKISNSLSNSMNESINICKIKSLIEIANRIKESINVHFINNKGTITKEYSALLNKLQKLEKNLCKKGF